MQYRRASAHMSGCGLIAAAVFWHARALAADPGALEPAPGDAPQTAPGASSSSSDSSRGAADAQLDTGAQDASAGAPRPENTAALEVGAELGVLSRQFEYHQDVNDNLRDNDVSLAPTIGARLAWYPGAHFSRGTLANLGLIGSYERSLFASSSTESSQDFDMLMQQYAFGARWRFPFDRHQIGVSFVYGRQELTLDAGREPNAVSATGMSVDRDYVPDVAYVYVRPGLDARFAFERIQAGVGLGYRAVQQVGELAATEWFPQATARGIDAWLMIGFAIKPELIVFGTAAFSRYALAMNSTLQDLQVGRDVAGGAVDQLIAGRIGIEWRLPRAER